MEESATASRLALAAAGDGARLAYCELVEPPKPMGFFDRDPAIDLAP